MCWEGSGKELVRNENRSPPPQEYVHMHLSKLTNLRKSFKVAMWSEKPLEGWPNVVIMGCIYISTRCDMGTHSESLASCGKP